MRRQTPINKKKSTRQGRATSSQGRKLSRSPKVRKKKILAQVTSYSPRKRKSVDAFIDQDSPFGVFSLEGTKIADCNNRFASLLGIRSKNDLRGVHLTELCSPLKKRELGKWIKKAKGKTSHHSKIVLPLQKRGHEDITCELTLVQIKLDRESHTLCYVQDVSDREIWRDRAENSERMFRSVANSFVDALIITDLTGKVLFVNKEFEKLTKFSRDEAIKSSIPYSWLDEDDLKSSMLWIAGIREKHELRDFDIRWVSKYGTKISISLNTTLLRNAEGLPTAMINVARDITVRQKEQHLLRSQFKEIDMLYKLSHSLSSALSGRDVARITYDHLSNIDRIVSFSIEVLDSDHKKVLERYRLNREKELIEEIAFDGHIEKIENRFVKQMIREKKIVVSKRSTKESDRDNSQEITLFVPLISSTRIIAVMAIGIRDGHEIGSERVLLIENIANLVSIALEKSRYQDAIVKQSKAIEAQNKELDDYAYVISHDLREPLVSIEGFARILKHESEDLNDAQQEHLQSILTASLHMRKMIDELLAISRVLRSHESITQIDVRSIIAEVLDELQFTIKERNALVSIQEKLPRITGVETHLKIVFRNLLSNALKFCDKPDPKISIECSSDDSMASFSIRDNGIGFDEADRDRIFVIFHRLDRSDRYSGIGAGLTIVKKIIDNHGGKIWATSIVNEGSTFTFTLPLYMDK